MSRITTPFTRESTADEVIADADLSGRRAVVTGGASGIGVETARALAAAGAEVTLAVRNLEAGRQAAAGISAKTGNPGVFVAPLELADRESVAAFAANWEGQLDLLINNAGVMAEPLNRTPEGWEHQFATNHLGHFGLALGLHPALAAAGNARIVSVSSSAHLRSGIVFDDIHFENRPYDEWSAYGQSKTANVLFAVEATKRWAPDGITANALMPGGIRTALQPRRPRSCSRSPHCWKASAVATSRTATRRSPMRLATRAATCLAHRATASRRTPWTPRPPPDCGTSPWKCSTGEEGPGRSRTVTN
jgi:NAD(P)-dependent dehydrogenase (short-subunit alcohol dehydrogenase family)